MPARKSATGAHPEKDRRESLRDSRRAWERKSGALPAISGAIRAGMSPAKAAELDWFYAGIRPHPTDPRGYGAGDFPGLAVVRQLFRLPARSGSGFASAKAGRATPPRFQDGGQVAPYNPDDELIAPTVPPTLAEIAEAQRRAAVLRARQNQADFQSMLQKNSAELRDADQAALLNPEVPVLERRGLPFNIAPKIDERRAAMAERAQDAQVEQWAKQALNYTEGPYAGFMHERQDAERQTEAALRQRRLNAVVDAIRNKIQELGGSAPPTADTHEGYGDYADGALSYFGGLKNFAYNTTRRFGAGDDAELADRLQREEAIFDTGLDYAISNPALADAIIQDYIRKNRAYIVGRLGAGAATGVVLGAVLNKYLGKLPGKYTGYALGPALGAAALTGDVEEKLRQGVDLAYVDGKYDPERALLMIIQGIINGAP
jgi:hypothetical protein